MIAFIIHVISRAKRRKTNVRLNRTLMVDEYLELQKKKTEEWRNQVGFGSWFAVGWLSIVTGHQIRRLPFAGTICSPAGGCMHPTAG
jgi:hypothetical protein